MSYILYLNLIVNLGLFNGSFVGHSEKPFDTIEQCQQAATVLEFKAKDRLGGALLSFQGKCVETQIKGMKM